MEKGRVTIYGLEVCKAMGLDKDLNLSTSVQLEITGSDNGYRINRSNYNYDIVMDKCQICFNNRNKSYKRQNTADENNIIGRHSKMKHNLVLCESCGIMGYNEDLRIMVI